MVTTAVISISILVVQNSILCERKVQELNEKKLNFPHFLHR